MNRQPLKFTTCQEDLLRKHLRFRNHSETGVSLDISSVTSPLLINMTAYDGIKSLFDKHSYDTIVVVEGDAWMYAQPLALEYHKEIVVVRNMSSLPYQAMCETYRSSREIHTLELENDKLSTSNKVLIVGNVIATGQMATALVRLVRRTEAQLVGVAALVSLDYLPRANSQFLADIPTRVVLHYAEPPES